MSWFNFAKEDSSLVLQAPLLINGRKQMNILQNCAKSFNMEREKSFSFFFLNALPTWPFKPGQSVKWTLEQEHTKIQNTDQDLESDNYLYQYIDISSNLLWPMKYLKYSLNKFSIIILRIHCLLPKDVMRDSKWFFYLKRTFITSQCFLYFCMHTKK